jgi:hypothetical protein
MVTFSTAEAAATALKKGARFRGATIDLQWAAPESDAQESGVGGGGEGGGEEE